MSTYQLNPAIEYHKSTPFTDWHLGVKLKILLVGFFHFVDNSCWLQLISKESIYCYCRNLHESQNALLVALEEYHQEISDSLIGHCCPQNSVIAQPQYGRFTLVKSKNVSLWISDIMNSIRGENITIFWKIGTLTLNIVTCKSWSCFWMTLSSKDCAMISLRLFRYAWNICTGHVSKFKPRMKYPQFCLF